jgi:myosin heavy subunit
MTSGVLAPFHYGGTDHEDNEGVIENFSDDETEAMEGLTHDDNDGEDENIAMEEPVPKRRKKVSPAVRKNLREYVERTTNELKGKTLELNENSKVISQLAKQNIAITEKVEELELNKTTLVKTLSEKNLDLEKLEKLLSEKREELKQLDVDSSAKYSAYVNEINSLKQDMEKRMHIHESREEYIKRLEIKCEDSENKCKEIKVIVKEAEYLEIKLGKKDAMLKEKDILNAKIKCELANSKVMLKSQVETIATFTRPARRAGAGSIFQGFCLCVCRV